MSANITTFSKPVDTEIKDISEQIGKHELGTSVDISGYDSSTNMFEAPSDGYVIINSGTGTNNSGNLLTKIGSSTVYLLTVRTVSSGYGNVGSLFVRKGFKAYVSLSSSTATFRPLE